MSKTTDLHVHTLVSDGTNTPMEVFSAAKEVGLSTISFTDHDALGAYRHFGDVFAQAKALGIKLISGIELDTDYQGREVHLLGYGFNLDDGPLNKHLNVTQRLRKEKVSLQLAIINRFFGRKVIDLDQILFPCGSPSGTDKSDSPKSANDLCCPSGTDKSDSPHEGVVSLDDSNGLRAGWNHSEINQRSANDLCCRDTLMKPHLVHAMLAQGLFSEYRAAAYWLSQNVQVPVVVPKLPLSSAISLLRSAGGDAVLAHPGYLVRESGISLVSLLTEFVTLGLYGLEVDYPYIGTSPEFPDIPSEQAIIDELRSLAERYSLKTTRGSDAHTTEALKLFARNWPA